MQNKVVLDGIVEADETYLPISYKGNHKKSKRFVMPRPARHRGNDHEFDSNGKIVPNLVALSRNKVCVPCAINRNGLSVARVGRLGKVNLDCLTNVFSSQIKKGVVLCADGDHSYKKFAKNNELTLYRIIDRKSIKGIYNIQRINSYHSNLKTFLRKFKGVSTKYLNNYLVWNNLVNFSKGTEIEKKRILMEHIFTIPYKERFIDVPDRKPLPILA